MPLVALTVLGGAPVAGATSTRGGASANACHLAPPGPSGERRLSDESRCSRWSDVFAEVPARAEPDPGAPTVHTLRALTADGTSELVLALGERTGSDGRTWVHVRLPMRPNGRTGWVPRSALGPYRVVTTALRIDRRARRAVLLRAGRRVWSAPIGVGRPGTITPTGRFYVRERLVPKGPHGLYGVLAFGTSAYSATLTDWPGGGVIGIHGTNEPALIPGAISHGCVRIENRRIRRLGQLMPLGTPILIT